MTQSVEPMIADLVNSRLKSYCLDYKLEQESLNSEIDKALEDYFSKNGGNGGNRPDAKLLLRCGKDLRDYPILIEYKGYKDKLVKLNSNGQVENSTSKNEINFKNIRDYAVNGAVHYANALLHYTTYEDIISIGVTGYEDGFGKLQYEIGVYYVSKSNLGAGQKVGEFSDLSFLKKENFDNFIKQVKDLSLTEEQLLKIKEQREREIDKSLVKLNNDIYQNEKGLGENDRVYLVAASIIASLGIPGKVPPLEKSELKSQSYKGGRDGDIMINRITAFLNEKNLPDAKKDLIISTLKNTLSTDNINKNNNGESQLKRVFTKIIDDLGIYYKIGLTTDFTGKLFNEMYGWLGFSQDKLNDVVLTPPYVAKLLVKLARVNRNSYVWDFATGSAGLLVAALNEMLIDLKNNVHSPDEFNIKEAKIKGEQLLGLEILSSVYMLAVLNMILVGDGSSNILNQDSLKDFDGYYGYGKGNNKFPADAFILNPPYSAEGNGMIFVERALSMMQRGYAAIIIQGSAGNGKAKDYNRRILKNNTLLASIKMPNDLFVGKSNVQTYVYVFKVNEQHNPDDIVKFIDFSNDGYSRSNRKKASNNLRDVDNAKERYQEIVDLVRFGKEKLKYFSEKEYYEGHINPNAGNDWNQIAPIDTKPTLKDFKTTVSEYLSWEVSNLLKNNKYGNIDSVKSSKTVINEETERKEFQLDSLFTIIGNPSLNKENLTFSEDSIYPYFTRTESNNGIQGYVDYLDEEHKISGGCLAVGMIGMRFFYMDRDFYAGPFTKRAVPINFKLTTRRANFLISLLDRNKKIFQNVLVRDFETTFYNTKILLPIKNGEIDFDYMDRFISSLEMERLSELEIYLKQRD